MTHIINPESRRPVKIGGKAYNSLVARGIIHSDLNKTKKTKNQTKDVDKKLTRTKSVKELNALKKQSKDFDTTFQKSCVEIPLDEYKILLKMMAKNKEMINDEISDSEISDIDENYSDYSDE
jgi:hypothetical protein